MAATPLRQPGQPARLGDHEPAFAGDGLDHHARDRRRAHHGLEDVDGLGQGAGAPEGVGVRGPVHLGCEGTEPLLVGHGLAREAHPQQRASVEAVVEGDDAAAPGGVAGHLHGVLDGLGPGVHEERALLVVRPASAALRRSHTSTYPRYGVTWKQVWVKRSDLLAHRGDDARRAVADVGHRDPRRQVDQPVAVDVLDDPAPGPGHEHARASCPPRPGSPRGGDP